MSESVTIPSTAFKHHAKVIDVDGVPVSMLLITMKQSFLLSVSNPGIEDDVNDVSPSAMIKGFEGNFLRGLSMAIGEHNTSIVQSSNSLESAALATRLSKSLNQNRPVYVVNTFQAPQDADPYDSARDDLSMNEFNSKLYMRIFQYIRDNYNGTGDGTNNGSNNKI